MECGAVMRELPGNKDIYEIAGDMYNVDIIQFLTFRCLGFDIHSELNATNERDGVLSARITINSSATLKRIDRVVKWCFDFPEYELLYGALTAVSEGCPDAIAPLIAANTADIGTAAMAALGPDGGRLLRMCFVAAYERMAERETAAYSSIGWACRPNGPLTGLYVQLIRRGISGVTPEGMGMVLLPFYQTALRECEAI